MPGESYVQRRLEGYSTWGRRKLEMTECTHTHTHAHTHTHTHTNTHTHTHTLPEGNLDFVGLKFIELGHKNTKLRARKNILRAYLHVKS